MVMHATTRAQRNLQAQCNAMQVRFLRPGRPAPARFRPSRHMPHASTNHLAMHLLQPLEKRRSSGINQALATPDVKQLTPPPPEHQQASKCTGNSDVFRELEQEQEQPNRDGSFLIALLFAVLATGQIRRTSDDLQAEAISVTTNN